MRELAEKYYRLLIRAASGLQSPFLLAIRLYWDGNSCRPDGGSCPISIRSWASLPNWVYPHRRSTHGSSPALSLPEAWCCLGSRLVALPLVIDMIVAYITADREALFSIVSSPDKFMAAAPFTFLVASLIILIFGPGKASVDALLAGRLWGRRIARDFSGSRALAQN